MNKIISYLKTVDTPTICNAIELLEIRPYTSNFTSNKIRCLYPDLGPMVGYAVTVQMETVTQMAPRDPQMTLKFYEAIETSPKPAIIVIQEIGAFGEFAAHSGEVTTTLAKHFGAIGLVTDSNVRDFEEVRNMKFHTFARGLSPSHVNCRIVSVGIPVEIHGMTVRAGDIIHGDVNGLTEVPKQKLDQLAGKIEQVRTSEQALMSRVKKGHFTIEDLRDILIK